MQSRSKAAWLLLLALGLIAVASLQFRPEPDETPKDHVVIPADRQGLRGSADSAETTGERSEPKPPVETTPFQEKVARTEEPVLDGPILTVLTSPGNTPVPNAKIRFVNLGGIDQQELYDAMAIRPDPYEGMIRLGLALETDEHGTVRLPRYQGVALVCGETETLFGFGGIGDPETSPLELRLYADLDVEFLAEDSRGNPVGGFPLVLQSPTKSLEAAAWSGTTAAGTGKATARHLNWIFEGFGNGESQLALRPGFPCECPTLALIDRSSAPTAALRFRVPATGRIVVEVLGIGGAPLPTGVFVSLARAAPQSATAPIPGITAKSRVVAGRAVFERVGLGLNLEVSANITSKILKPVSVPAKGPTAEGEEILVRLQFEEAFPAIVGQAVDDSGRPLDEHRISARLDDAQDWKLPMPTVMTDHEGRFVLPVILPDPSLAPLPRPKDLGKPRLVLSASSESRGFPNSNAAKAIWPLPNRPGAPRLEAGVLMFRRQPIVAAGDVVNRKGDPISRVSIGIERLTRRHERDKWPTWGRLWSLGAQTNRSGAFEVRGECEAGEVRVIAEADGWYESDRMPVTAGATGVRIVMDQAGIVEGRVRVPRGLAAPKVHVTVRGAPASTFKSGAKVSRPEDARLTTSLNRDGGFRWSRLKPGTGELLVHVGWNDIPLVTIEDVEVRAGENTEDPRLFEIDLSGVLHVREIRVIDGESRPVSGAELEIVDPEDRATSENPTTNERGIAHVIARDSEIDLRVRARGYRDTLLLGIDSDREIALGEAIPVRLILTGSWYPPEPPYSLSIALVPTTPTSASRPGEKVLTDAREAEFLVGSAGPHRVALSLVRNSGDRQDTRPIEGLEPNVIEIIDSAVEQIFQIPVTEARLAAAFEALRNVR